MVFKSKNHKGFTIVELMIAISVFSVVMIIATTGILLIARQYQAGVTKTAMQSATRDIHQKISDSIKYSGGKITVEENSGNVTGYYVVCVGKIRYFYKTPSRLINNETDFNNMSGLHFQQQTNPYKNGNALAGECGYLVNDDINAQQLLPNNAKVALFNVTETEDEGVTKTAIIDTTFVKGDYDLFNLGVPPKDLKCKSGVGNEWCSVVSLSSIVNPRL